MPKLLEIKAKSNLPITFHVRVELGDGQELPAEQIAAEVNSVLSEIKAGFAVR